MKYLSLIVPGPAGDIAVKTPSGISGDANALNLLPQFAASAIVLIVVVAALAMIIFSGIQWITSGGDAKKIEGARNRLTYSIIGLIVALAAALIVGTVIRLL